MQIKSQKIINEIKRINRNSIFALARLYSKMRRLQRYGDFSDRDWRDASNENYRLF